MEDFLGNHYDVGDRVVWPYGVGGHSIQMASGVVLEIRSDGCVKIQPDVDNGSRGTVKYYDNRTDEEIHWKDFDKYRLKQPGYYHRGTREPMPRPAPYDYPKDYEWLAGEWQSYVRVVHAMRPVIIGKVENIVKAIDGLH